MLYKAKKGEQKEPVIFFGYNYLNLTQFKLSNYFYCYMLTRLFINCFIHIRKGAPIIMFNNANYI